ncbi:MAG: hypothetical protein KUG82_21720 [Pseudomonadales bacterium]|nr:hypothetical protein [Pseudomonadales bacterium]
MSCKDVTSVIKRDLQRYRSLRRHLDERSEFNRRLNRVQAFRQQRMRINHDALFSDPHDRRVMEFFLLEMYAGLDLSQVGSNFEKAIKLALKLVSNPELVSATLEYSVLAAELDELLVAVLFENMKVKEITADNYINANRLANSYENRIRQIELIKSLTLDLDKNSKSRLVYSAFKIAKGPAKLGGLGDMYGILAKGYEAVRYVKSPERLVAAMMDIEMRLLTEMFANADARIAQHK